MRLIERLFSDEMDENDIVNWFDSVSTFIPEVKEELGQYYRLKKEKQLA